MPRVSVVIPVYNSAKFLHRCIGSLLAQTEKDCEFIFVNDGSKDDSANIIGSYGETDNRIRLINQENKGVSGARNTGIAHTTARYLAFVDADDTIAPDYFETLLQTISLDDADLSVCGFIGSEERFLPDGKITLDKTDEAKIIALFESFLIHNVYCKLYLRDIIIGHGLRFDPAFNFGEDFLFNLQYLRNIKTIATSSEVLYYYDVSVPDSLAKQYHIVRYKAVEIQIQATADYFQSIGLSSLQKNDYINALYYWNAYDAAHNLYATISKTPKREAADSIKAILGFRYFNSDISHTERESLIVRIFSLKNPTLIQWLLRLHRKMRR